MTGKSDTVRIRVRVRDTTGKRIATAVDVEQVGNPKVRFEGQSRGETADANDILGFDVPANRDFVIRVRGVEKTISARQTTTEPVIEVVLAGK
jgi:hypothetical protein